MQHPDELCNNENESNSGNKVSLIERENMAFFYRMIQVILDDHISLQCSCNMHFRTTLLDSSNGR